jgi:penicillin-binding protein 1B
MAHQGANRSVSILALHMHCLHAMGPMEPNMELLEPPVEDLETAGPPPPQPRLLERPRVRLALKILAGIFIAGVVAFLIAYLKVAGMINRRLADGAFSSTVGIYSAPRQVAPGDPMTPQEIAERLRRSGYSTSPDNPLGWFVERPSSVDVHPGPESLATSEPASIEFAGGKIARIFSLRDRSPRQDYLLDPQLIANITGDREKRTLVRYQDIPRPLVHAVISAEDKRFFKHTGFDPFRIVKAAYVDLRDGRKQQGASTLSMQLARGLWLDGEKRWRRKLAELVITVHLELKLTKQQIFENYANQVFLGRRGTFNIQGFGEASRAFLGKDLSKVDSAEAALLAGLIQRPSYYNPVRFPERARERRDVVLGMMHQNGYLTAAEYFQALSAPVRVAERPLDESAAPYFTALVQDELQDRLSDSIKPTRYVATTLDPDLQRAAEEAVRMGMENVDRQLQRRRKSADDPRPQVALVAVDPRTGQIRALVGGRDYTASQLNHAISQRQPGSVFKPFVYTAALASAFEGAGRVFTPATILSDNATTFYFDRKTYSPGNFHGNFMGQVTLRTALAHSLNVATVSLASQVGLEKVVAMAQRAGLNSRIQATPAVALGAYEATPLEIAGAYTMFANQGIRTTPTTVAEVRGPDGTLLYRRTPESRPALDPRVNFLMVDLLQEVIRSGTAAGVRARGFTQPAAGKTGTSRDGWFAGFTTELVTVVWVGYDDNRELKLEGSKSALPIWAEFMKRAAQLRPYRNAKPFPQAGGITSAQICEESGLRAGSSCSRVRWERFVAGTAPASECNGHSLMTYLPFEQ